MHYFTIEQRETLEKMLQSRAGILREEIREDAQADLNAEPEAVALKLATNATPIATTATRGAIRPSRN